MKLKNLIKKWSEKTAEGMRQDGLDEDLESNVLRKVKRGWFILGVGIIVQIVILIRVVIPIEDLEKTNILKENLDLKEDIAELQIKNTRLQEQMTDLEHTNDMLRREKDAMSKEIKRSEVWVQLEQDKLNQIFEEMSLIGLIVEEREDGSLVLRPKYREIFPFEFDKNGKVLRQRHQKNVLYLLQPIDTQKKIYFNFSMPFVGWDGNYEFVAISPSGEEQLIAEQVSTEYKIALEERGIYVVELRNLDKTAESMSFTFIW